MIFDQNYHKSDNGGLSDRPPDPLRPIYKYHKSDNWGALRPLLPALKR